MLSLTRTFRSFAREAAFRIDGIGVLGSDLGDACGPCRKTLFGNLDLEVHQATFRLSLI